MWCQNWMQRETVHHLRPVPVKPLRSVPDSDEHHERIAVVHDFGSDQPWIPKAEDAVRFGTRPAEVVDLNGLREVFAPVPEDNQHEKPEGSFVPLGVEAFVEARLLLGSIANARQAGT